MAHRFTGSEALLVMAVGGLLMSAQFVVAPLAYACPEGQLQDAVTGMCWTQSGQGSSYGGPGDGPCLPGRLGNCVGELQKSSPPNVQIPAVACGYGAFDDPSCNSSW